MCIFKAASATCCCYIQKTSDVRSKKKEACMLMCLSKCIHMYLNMHVYADKCIYVGKYFLIVNSKFLKHYSEAKSSAPAYS